MITKTILPKRAFSLINSRVCIQLKGHAFNCPCCPKRASFSTTTSKKVSTKEEKNGSSSSTTSMSNKDKKIKTTPISSISPIIKAEIEEIEYYDRLIAKSSPPNENHLTSDQVIKKYNPNSSMTIIPPSHKNDFKASFIKETSDAIYKISFNPSTLIESIQLTDEDCEEDEGDDDFEGIEEDSDDLIDNDDSSNDISMENEDGEFNDAEEFNDIEGGEVEGEDFEGNPFMFDLEIKNKSNSHSLVMQIEASEDGEAFINDMKLFKKDASLVPGHRSFDLLEDSIKEGFEKIVMENCAPLIPFIVDYSEAIDRESYALWLKEVDVFASN